MKDIFEENWAYKAMVFLSLGILLIYTYIANESTIINCSKGVFLFDAKLIWQLGIYALLALVLFYLLDSALDYKSQGDVLKEYIQRIQNDLSVERDALQDLKSASGDKILELGSFIVTISDMAKELNSVLETKPLLKAILDKTAELLGSQKCAVFSVSKDKKAICLVDAIGYNKNDISDLDLKCDENSGMLGISAMEGKFYSRSALNDDYNKKHVLENDRLQIKFCQPIKYENEILAVICVGDTREGLADVHAIRILSAMANLGAVALTNTRLVDKIKDQSIRDGLTGLYNHQYFQQQFDTLLNKAIAEKSPLGFIIIDLDRFKKLNDTYGHQMGDAGLKKLAQILRADTKPTDIIARYGGEEFVCVSPGSNLQETIELADKIRNDFKNATLESEVSRTSCTLSAGVCAYLPDKTKNIRKNSLIHAADMALYEAKEKGRDSVVFAKGV
ncbi:MAG: sensor domain-containing diguanylate cyclase [Candidatus Omnitrophota bacterium]